MGASGHTSGGEKHQGQKDPMTFVLIHKLISCILEMHRQHGGIGCAAGRQFAHLIHITQKEQEQDFLCPGKRTLLGVHQLEAVSAGVLCSNPPRKCA